MAPLGKALSIVARRDSELVPTLPQALASRGMPRRDDPEKPRADLKRPWEAVAKRAGLDGVRLHDLRHTYASFGAGGGLGLPIIGKLLGHTQASTTARYAHLDNDPLRRATEAIGGRIAAAMEGKPMAEILEMRQRGSRRS